MPAPAPRQSRYPAKVHTLRDAAALGQLVCIRCPLCRRAATYLASDLALLLDPRQDALQPPFPCSACGKNEYVQVSLRLPEAGDWGNLVVRRPGPVRRIQTWRSARLGD